MTDFMEEKSMRGILRPESYEHDLVDKIEEIKSKASAFKDQANICGQKKVANIESNTQLLCHAAEKNDVAQGISMPSCQLAIRKAADRSSLQHDERHEE